MHDKGFTLIEILVVLLIMSISFGFAALSFGDFGASRKARITAEQFSDYVTFLEQQAILETTLFGIRLKTDGYQTLRFNGQAWSTMPEKSIFHTRLFPNKVLAHIENHRPAQSSLNPDIWVDASGNLSPFVLHFGTQEKPNVVTLSSHHQGDVMLTASESS